MPNRPVPRSAALAAVAAAAALFGTSGTARSLGPDGLSSQLIAAWRTIIGAIGLALAAWRFATPVHRAPLRWRPILVAAPSVLGYQLAFFAAVDRVGVANATIVSLGTAPIAAGLIDRIWRGHRLHPRWAGGVALAAAGIGALSGVGGWQAAPTGWLMAVIAGSAFPVYAAAAQDLSRDRPTLTAMATIFVAGAVPGVVVAAATTSSAQVSSAAVATVLYLGFVATALAYGLWSLGLRLPLRDSVTLTLIEPVSATLLAVVFLDEQLGLVDLAGIVAVIAGVLIATSVDTPTSTVGASSTRLHV